MLQIGFGIDKDCESARVKADGHAQEAECSVNAANRENVVVVIAESFDSKFSDLEG